MAEPVPEITQDEVRILLRLALEDLVAAALAAATTASTSFNTLRRTQAIRRRTSRKLTLAAKNYHKVICISKNLL